MNNQRNNFIHNTGLSRDNSLVHLNDSLIKNVDEEISVIEHSKYFEDNDFIEMTSVTPRKLSIMNLNSQSLMPNLMSFKFLFLIFVVILQLM